MVKKHTGMDYNICEIQLLKSFIEFQFTTLPGAINATGKIKKYTIWSSISNIMQFIYLFFKISFPPIPCISRLYYSGIYVFTSLRCIMLNYISIIHFCILQKNIIAIIYHNYISYGFTIYSSKPV